MADGPDPLTHLRPTAESSYGGGVPVVPVSHFISSARHLIERRLPLAWISGEISGCSRAASGHFYFTLKDSAAQARCVLFRLKAQGLGVALRDGLAVEVRATATIFEPRGEFQLNVETVRLAGAGVLYERFVRLKAKLDSAGWFAPERKRVLPPYPRAIGVVTSTRAAALRDVLATFARRWPAVRIRIYPASVQGDGAAGEIAAAIRAANARAEVDLLIVCRGGGSLEDLWAFNEEVVARAIFESELPVISGVGHETDFTICDFVADVRAPTPTAAAALAVADRVALAHKLEQLARRAARASNHMLATRIQRVDHASRRLIHPAARLALQRERAAMLAKRLARASRLTLAAHQRDVASMQADWRRHGRERIARAAVRVGALAQNLAHLNPQAVLERGYAIVTSASGAIVQDSAELTPGDDVTLMLSRGRAGATITTRER